MWLKSPHRMNLFLSADEAKGKKEKCFDMGRCPTHFSSLLFSEVFQGS